ncbi:MAG: TonB-dependent receptor [Bacteroidales bacterium]|nr:TonB-dependent receptor [Bacteroidales bacterium]
MKGILPYSLILVWLVVFCAGVSAQNSDTVITKNLREIDVFADKETNKSSIVQALEGKFICLMPVSEISDVLKLFSGLNIKDYGGTGGLKTVSVRSLGASHTAVEYDGVPVSNTLGGQIDISRFQTGSVSEINLCIGQTDNLLKPAKLFAAGAVLSIKSFDAFLPEPQKLKLNFKTGSFGYLSLGTDFLKKIGKHLIFSVNADFLRSDGMYSFTLKNYKTVTKEKRRNTDIRSGKMEFSLNFNDSIRNSFNIKFYGYKSERGLPGSVVFYNPHAEERLKDADFFVQTDYKRRIFSNLTTKLIAKYDYSNNYYTDKNVMYTDGKLKQNSTQNEVFFSWINFWQVIPPLSFSVSIDESFNTLESDITDRQPKRNTIQSVANLRYRFRNLLSFTLGEVFTHLREKTVKGAHLNDLDKFSPYMTVEVFLTKNFTADILLKNTYRVPTFNELYYTTLGSTALEPEDASEVNFGVCYGKKTWNVSADFYHNNVDNKIVAIPTLYVWKMSNCGRVKISGADFSLDKNFSFPQFDMSIDVCAKYSYQKAVDVTDEKSKLYNNQIPYTPLHSGNFYSVFKYRNYALSLVSVLSGKRYFLAYNIPDNEISGYAEFSASLVREFSVKNTQILVKFSCINFTNEQYDVIKFYPMPGRQYQLNLTLTL